MSDLGVDGLQSVSRGRRPVRQAVKGKVRSRRGAERPDATLSAEKLKRGRLTCTFSSVSRDQWAKAFGQRSAEEQMAVFRQALAEQREKQAQQEQQQAREYRSAAVHGDNKGAGRRLYQGFDYGLGVFIHGKAHRRAEMQRQRVDEAG